MEQSDFCKFRLVLVLSSDSFFFMGCIWQNLFDMHEWFFYYFFYSVLIQWSVKQHLLRIRWSGNWCCNSSCLDFLIQYSPVRVSVCPLKKKIKKAGPDIFLELHDTVPFQPGNLELEFCFSDRFLKTSWFISLFASLLQSLGIIWPCLKGRSEA